MSMFYIGGELAQSRLGLPKSLTGVFQGLLLFTLLACDTLDPLPVRWHRLAPAAAAHRRGVSAPSMDDAVRCCIAATLNAGTVLAFAALGLLINERAGIVNLGAEGMMLVAAIAGFATAVHTGNDWLGFAAGARGRRAAGGGLRRAGDLAQHQPVRDRPGAEPVRRRLLGLRRHPLRAGEAGRARRTSHPGAGRHPVRRARRCSGSTRWCTSPIALAVGLTWFLYRSRAGLVLRSVGESPESAHALGYPVRRIRLLAVIAGGALCGLAGAYLSVVYTPLWVEGMVAGKGWIALALTTFATWRPARVLLGAYLFGGVTMLQFHLQGTGRRGAQPVPHHAAVPRHHRGAGADLAQPGVDPRQHAGLAGKAVLSRLIIAFRSVSRHPVLEEINMNDLNKRSLLKLAALRLRSPRPPPGRLRQEGRGARAGRRAAPAPAAGCRSARGPGR